MRTAANGRETGPGMQGAPKTGRQARFKALRGRYLWARDVRTLTGRRTRQGREFLYCVFFPQYEPDAFRLALGRRYNRVKKAAHGREGRTFSGGQSDHPKTAERLAKEHGVDERTVRRAACRRARREPGHRQKGLKMSPLSQSAQPSVWLANTAANTGERFSKIVVLQTAQKRLIGL